MSLPPIVEKSEIKNSLSKIYDSKSSLNMKKTQLAKVSRPRFTEGADEIIRLTKVIDSQKLLIDRYSDDLKTLKIINYRQDKAIKKFDKDKSLAPQAIHTLHEDLKIARLERTKYLNLANKHEKSIQRQSNTIASLKKQIRDLNALINSKQGQDGSKLRSENDQLNNKLKDAIHELDQANRKLKLVEAEKDRDTKNYKSTINKQAQQIENLNNQITRLHAQIDEKDKHINSLNIYSTHAAERKQLRSRTAQERAQTAADQASKLDQAQGNDVPSDHHPLTDAIINSIMTKNALKNNNNQTPVSPQNIIHKPNMSYYKTESNNESNHESNNESNHETVEDILARRMRDHISINSPSQSTD